MPVAVILWAVGGGKCVGGGHFLGCLRHKVCLWRSFFGLLEAASVLVGVICWDVGGGKFVCGGHLLGCWRQQICLWGLFDCR